MVQNVIPFNTEPVVTGTKQVVKLPKVGQVSYIMPEVPAPKVCKVCNDLTYEFPVSKSQSSQITSRQSQKEYFQSLTKQPKQISFIPAIFESLNTEELSTQIVEKLILVSEQLHSTELFAEKEIPSQLKALKTIVSVLKTSQLEKIWQSIESLSASQEVKQTVRNLFIDIVRNSGSSPCVMFILELLKTYQLTEIENYYTIVTLGHYIKTPTEELIHQIFLTIKSPAVQEKFWLKGSAHLAFANLVCNACLGSAKTLSMFSAKCALPPTRRSSRNTFPTSTRSSRAPPPPLTSRLLSGPSKLLENGGGDGGSMIPVKVNPFRALNQISPYAARVRKSMISIQTSVTV